MELSDSSTAGGRSLVSCFHVILSATGRGGGLRSLSARTTTPASPVGERPGRRRLDGGGAPGSSSPGPRPPLPSSAGRWPPLRPERERTASGRSCRLSAGGGWWAPHPCSSLAPAPSDMVAPGSVTSRLGSVFPFLLVLVDLQYEGESCAALAGAGPPALPLLSPGASLGAAGPCSGSRGLRGSAGPEPAPGRGPALGSGFVRGRGAWRVWSQERERRGPGQRGPGQRLLGRPGTRRFGQPSGPGLARDLRLAPWGPCWSVVLGGGGKGGQRGGIFRPGVPGEAGMSGWVSRRGQLPVKSG